MSCHDVLCAIDETEWPVVYEELGPISEEDYARFIGGHWCDITADIMRGVGIPPDVFKGIEDSSSPVYEDDAGDVADRG